MNRSVSIYCRYRDVKSPPCLPQAGFLEIEIDQVELTVAGLGQSVRHTQSFQTERLGSI
jgi:hypothetical protein